jgi:homoserine dehydrogenase
VKASDKNWAKSYAKQALSDLRARESLVSANADKCHRLHFLQMAAEKACKAHMVTMNGHDSVRKSHAYVAGILPVIARQFFTVASNKNPISHWEIREIRRLAREFRVSTNFPASTMARPTDHLSC